LKKEDPRSTRKGRDSKNLMKKKKPGEPNAILGKECA